MRNIRWIGALAFISAGASCISAQVSLGLGASGQAGLSASDDGDDDEDEDEDDEDDDDDDDGPGKPVKVRLGQTFFVPISFKARGAQVASLQWTVNYDPRAFTHPVMKVAAAVQAAGKALRCHAATPGRMTCLVAGLNTRALSQGVVASLSLMAVSPGSSAITSNRSSGATPAGAAVLVGAASRTVEVEPDPSGLQSLTCLSLSLPVGASTTCTVTLTRAAPAAGVSVAVATTSTSTAVLNAARSFRIGAGLSRATFAAQLSAGNAGAAATLTVRVQGVSRSLTFTVASGALRVTPAAIRLYASQSVHFQAFLSGGGTPAVLWSIAPALGRVSGAGVYTAPARIDEATEVTLTAVRVTDRTSKGSAVITLLPRRSIEISPAISYLSPGQTLQFRAAVTRADGAGVEWSLRPAGTGTLSRSGLYTAPSAVKGVTWVVVEAGFAGDPGHTARAVVMIRGAAAPARAYSVFPDNATPRLLDDGDAKAVELGMAFYPDTDGQVTGVRFYKGSKANRGPHVANLWTASGKLLATATFVNETNAGWQQVQFAAPVRIQANTRYVVSYFAPGGHYSVTEDYFGKGINKSPLHVPAGSAGVYRYGRSGGFPTDSYERSNYWVDVLFTKPDAHGL